MNEKLLESLSDEFGDLASGAHAGDAWVRVDRAILHDVVRHLKERAGCELLLDVVGVDLSEHPDHLDDPTRFEVDYNLRSLAAGERLMVKVAVEEGQDVPTVSDLYASANWAEREVYDLFGVPFRGHPDLRRILCHHEFEGHALRKDYPIERGQVLSAPEKLFDDHEVARAAARAETATGTQLPSDLLTLNLGPSHPSTHGALRVECLIDGETIVEAKSEIGYLHRCFEKEAEDHTWAQVMPYTDRLNYVSAMLNNCIYAAAVEKMLGVEAPARAEAIRIVVSELSRIIDHLVCICANLVDIGALTNYWYFYNIREGIYYDIIEPLCGSRLTTNYARIGGLSHDIFEGFEAAVFRNLDKLQVAIREVTGLVARNRIFLDRTVGIGAMTTQQALDWGFTGPCLRATGLAFDLRKHAPYMGYDEYDFDVPVGEHGDTRDRIMVRIEEMLQSERIIRQVLARGLPGGPIIVDDPQVALPPKVQVYGSIEGVMNQFKLIYEGIKVPRGEAYGSGEGANGELGFHCFSDGGGAPYRIKVRPPCFPIFSAFATMIEGLMIPDAVAILGSINIIAGELDR
ncbi:NADH-quinone oxidoreductase subunit D [bacterium]|nr:NADH-quinone oxidoreductase subunit D [bacterium]MBU1073419.1 NADH-quinone oxidoreductase subunit D [bacterium]MBU1675654.1 NADH-quinone oxidoreductase subunit D [bacterium]